MSHFSLERDFVNVMKMDAPITKGPLPRWQRKVLENSTSSVNNSLHNISNSVNNSFISNTGTSNNKTPNKTPGKTKSTTPGRNKTPKTPTGTGSADRFIPNRSGMQFDIGHYMITQDREDDGNSNLSTQECQRLMGESLNGDLSNFRIMAYQNKAPSAPEGYCNSLRVLYSCSKAPNSTKRTTRYISQVPEKILDAPEIMDDYYLNILDWSMNNHLAIALGSRAYIWNASNGEIHLLTELEEAGDYVSSLSWIKEGNYLAMGTSSASIQLWDVENLKKLRTMTSHSERIGCLSWNNHILSSGSRSGQIHHHDVRVATHHQATLANHTQEVCGLKWSPDGRYLASGGNDNMLNIWSANMNSHLTDTQPLFTFTDHQAAVKAVAWCPWQSSVLASGGGTADRCIRFWNCNLGTCLNTIDTKSQVCALLWSREYKEIISGHGFANNELIIWKYPSMAKVAELTGHTARILNMAINPDGSTVVSAGADETLRLWKCFARDPDKKKEAKTSSSGVTRTLTSHIR